MDKNMYKGNYIQQGRIESFVDTIHENTKKTLQQ